MVALVNIDALQSELGTAASLLSDQRLPRIRSAARSPIMRVGAAVLPAGVTGMTEASAVRRPATPGPPSGG